MSTNIREICTARLQTNEMVVNATLRGLEEMSQYFILQKYAHRINTEKRKPRFPRNPVPTTIGKGAETQFVSVQYILYRMNRIKKI